MKEILEYISLAIDIVGISILIIGAVKFSYRYVIYEYRQVKGLESLHMMRDTRIEVGSYILIALEILIVSDVIHSALGRTIDGLIELGLLVIIRTLIGYFLGREIKELKKEA